MNRLTLLLWLLLPAAPTSALAAAPGRGLSMWIWVLLLPPTLALGVGLHAALARAVKLAVKRWAPLPRGEPRLAGYERTVHDSVDAPMQAVVGLAIVGGAALWFGAAMASPFGWTLAAITLFGAIALDLARWQRVEVGIEHVWFQRGLAHNVHQVLIENIRDASIELADVSGLTLRHGRDNATVRLKLRMKDRFVAALPKTGAYAGRAAVENVVRHIDERLASLRAEAAVRPVDPDRRLKRALKRLHRDPAAEPA